MATFRLVASDDLDITQAQIAFEVSGGNTYLKFGLLNADNRRHLESVVAGGRVGFFESGRELSDSEAPNARILANYDAENGIRVDRGFPSALIVGSDYTIKWTQARPGSDGVTEITIVEDEGVVRITDSIEVDNNVPMTLPFDYRVVRKRFTRFSPRFYPSVQAFDANAPLSADDPRYPQNISFDPAVPFLTAGFYVHYITFTPVSDGKLLLAIDLIEEEVVGERLVDADGYYLVDADGYYLVGEI